MCAIVQTYAMDSSKGVFILEFDWKSWFLDVWEENRRLTNFVARDLVAAEAMDKQPVNGMRPFREMLFEIWGIENAYLRGLALDQWLCLPPALGQRTASVFRSH
ncbi:hypothetical protein ATW55_12410 [Ferroacidibacillus organovorans]|uniref:Uncharacterized protein n=1 Tax=Ferroacidibacillus organovorans TaxID=1765683 RepID=A0A101XT66_9BACL|nr:hypothetical protein ATW55_12410 [Ferroacidibacillus organovorans]